MENNNTNGGWYGSDQSSQYNGYNYNNGYQQPVPKKKKSVGLAGVIALMVAAVLLGTAIGAGAFYLSANSGKDKTAYVEPDVPASPEAPITVEDNAASPESPAQDTSGGSQASQGLTMGSSGSATEGSAVIQGSMASIVGIETEVGSGSGVIVTQDGYIVTNNHVISGTSTITVYLQDGTGYEAKLIGTDSYTDLAVIKIEANDLPAATLGDSTSVTVGDSVYAIGNPLGVLACSVSSGIISGLDRTVTIDGISMTLMQTDAAVNPGNSGGGLFSADGKLIGIINAKSTGLEVEGLGFAIPIDSAKPVIADLMDYGFVTGRPYIGITMQNISMADNSAQSGGNNDYFGYGFGGFSFNNYVTRVMVTAVESGSTAEQAGLQANDIILSLNGETAEGYTQLSVKLYEYKPGDVVTLTIQRGGSTMDIKLTLGSRSSAN